MLVVVVRHVYDQSRIEGEVVVGLVIGTCAAAQAEYEVDRRLLLDVVVRERAAVLELLAREDEALLVGRDALPVLVIQSEFSDGPTAC